MRTDGKLLRNVPYFYKIIPHIMPHRHDAQVFTPQRLRGDALLEYVRRKREEGHAEISFMSVLIASYVRAVSENPELNRFVIGKRIYARNELTISFVVLKQTGNSDEIVESSTKTPFDLTETVFEVSRKIAKTIEENRKVEDNAADILVNRIMNIPMMPGLVVAVIKLLDLWGIMPKAILDISPFHTSMFFTNMASIRNGYVFHHLYDFGTTSQFLALGSPEKQIDHTGKTRVFLPLGAVTDERICPGAKYVQAFRSMQHYLMHPELLETPPSIVKRDPML